MPNKKKSKKAVMESRRAKVASLVKAGLTYREVSKKLGWSVSTIGADMLVNIERWRTEALQSTEDWRLLELQRIDTALSGIWEKVKAGDQKAIHTFIKLGERRAKLQGLDAPAKVAGEIGVAIKLDEKMEEALERAYGNPGS